MRALIIRIGALLLVFVLLLLFLLIAAYAYLSTRTNGKLVSLGEQRSYLLHVPDSYDPASPTALVISLHGAYLYPGFQMRLSQWNELADEQGFIVVYPKAAGLPALWRLEPGEGLTAEVQFFSDLIDSLSETYNIDQNRIYANGYSNGAAMNIMLACHLSERIAAFGMVATPVVPWDWCKNSRPAPMIAIHGARDPFALYEGGENFLTTEPLISIQQWTALWAERNQCKAEPLQTEPAAIVTTRQYTDCSKDADVMLISLNEGGHVWPGGMKFPGNFAGPNADSINATREQWLFFQNHPLSH